MIRVILIWILFQITDIVVSSNWPIKRMSFMDGDLILGGFFPVHGRDNDRICGRLQDEGLIELEAFLFTVNRINDEPSLLPGIKLGVMAVDSCDSVPRSLEEAIGFAKGFVVRDDAKKAPDGKLFKCNVTNTLPVYESGKYEKVVAIIGGHSSWVSMQVADLMRLYKMPQVSYQSTSPLLSDKNLYDYFFRTVPPLDHQVKAIFDILKSFHWRYVAAVYADSAYGNKGFEAMKKMASRNSVCFSSHQRINVENSNADNYDFVLANLLRGNATAVIVFGDHEMARHLMSAATRAQAYSRFVWIGSSAWVSRDYVTSGNEEVMEGTIGISDDISPLEKFNEYLKDRKLKTHQEINPWFSEYWEEKMKCRLKNFADTPFNQNFTESCSENANLPSECYMHATPSVQFVRDAVHSVAHALHNMFVKKCKKRRGVCASMARVNGEELREYLREVEFKDENNRTFRFDKYGDGPPRYSIVNFQKDGITGRYSWVYVGDYYNVENSPNFNIENQKMRYKSDQFSFPESLCSAKCKVGQATVMLDDAKCCWHCVNCTEYQYLKRGTFCEECPLGTLPSVNKLDCEPIKLEYMDFSKPWAIGCITFSLIGVIMTVGVSVVFRKYYETPIFTVSGKELSILLLVGITLSFCLTFVIVSKPSVTSCGFVRFFLGFCYTISYATIAVKTRHLSKLCEQKASTKKPKHVNTKVLLLITLALIAVEGTINATWLLHSRPDTDYLYPSREENMLICKGFDSAGYLVGLVFPGLLMVFCTGYAFHYRDFMGAFNESRYINFTNYTTCVVWLGFIPMFVLNNNFLRTVLISLLLNLSAFVQLVCLFLPKVYLALRRPEKNKHENVMCYDGRQSTPVRS